MKSPVTFAVSVSKALLGQALGISFNRDYYFDPFLRHKIDARCHAYVAEQLNDLGAFYTESNHGRKQYFSPNQVLVGGIQPNLILGLLLGAGFIPADHGDADITPACWSGKPVADLPAPPALLEHPVIREFDEQIRAVQRDPALVAVPPFFWDVSGRAAIHGALTTAQKFFGEQFFMDMLAEPEEARRAIEWIADANLALVRHYVGLCGIELRGLHVGECSSCMIGPAEWSEFVAPSLDRLGRALAPVRLHSCGPSDHILQAARGISTLASLDLGGETSLARVRQWFGPDFPVSIAPPVKLLAGGSADDLMAWTKRVLADNQNGPLVILYHLEPQYPLSALRAWHAALPR